MKISGELNKSGAVNSVTIAVWIGMSSACQQLSSGDTKSVGAEFSRTCLGIPAMVWAWHTLCHLRMVRRRVKIILHTEMVCVPVYPFRYANPPVTGTDRPCHEAGLIWYFICCVVWSARSVYFGTSSPFVATAKSYLLKCQGSVGMANFFSLLAVLVQWTFQHCRSSQDKSFLSCRTKWQRSPCTLPGICAGFFQTCAISAGFELREFGLESVAFSGVQTLISQSCACFSTKNETIRAYKASFFYILYIYTHKGTSVALGLLHVSFHWLIKVKSVEKTLLVSS